jgi:hypothetical protein
MIRALLPGLALVLLLSACSSSSPEPSSDASELVRQVADSWDDVGSFHASIVQEEQPPNRFANIPPQAIDFEFVSPERMAYHTVTESGPSHVECSDVTDSSCETVFDEPREEYRSDSVASLHGVYSRSCQEDDCSDWAFFPWNFYGGLFGGASISLDGSDPALDSLADLLDSLQDPVIAGDSSDGAILLSAKFNPARVALEAGLVHAERFGLELGNTCDSVGFISQSIATGPGLASPTPSPLPDCRDYTADDYRYANQAIIKRFDDQPESIEVWVSRDSILPTRIEFSQPSELLRSPGSDENLANSSGAKTSFKISFDRFDQVTIDLPQLNTDSSGLLPQ